MTSTAVNPHPLLSRLVRAGNLTVHDGHRTWFLAGKDPGPAVELTVHSKRAWLRILRGGALGFAEAYMLGETDTPDLTSFLEWGARNQEAFRSGRLGHGVFAWAGRMWQWIANDLPHRTVGSTADHYNLGNDFYAAWLDETMSYSSARFDDPTQGLAPAQRNKYAALAELAGVEPGDRVLEIGCGWGGFAEFAAGEMGCHVTAITLSPEMAGYTRKRMAARGLGHLVEVRLEDFRQTTGTFDRIISVEMIESIDELQWPDLFATMRARLRKGGTVGMQAITIDDGVWDYYRNNRDFIQRYIFPGGQLPAPSVLTDLAVGNDLTIVRDEAFGEDYARTLARWHDRFDMAWPDLQGGQFDEHFRRMWKLYFSYCEAGFRLRRIDVHQLAMSPA